MTTKSVDSVATIVGYTHCHMSRHSIKEVLDVSLGYSSPCGFHILQKFIWCGNGGVSRARRCASMDHTFSIGDRSRG
ncbi:hypothetical protein TNCV_1604301 [Trichonephila clavipes]|nr:hypothetical protein TNCV_1604301 [Trichonephila clavipes]